MKLNFIDLKKQYSAYKNDIDNAINRTLEAGDFILGEPVSELEDELGSYTDTTCISVANGTDAIFISLMAIGISKGDEVIVPSFTWVSTVETVVLAGGSPVYCDIDQKTFNLDPKKLKNLITENTKAIIPVSIFGQTCDLTEICSIAKLFDIPVIEDAAQSFGATHFGKKSCSIADLSTTSFFPAKPLGCYGDGGAIFVKNKKFLDKISVIPRHGQKGRYNYLEVGVNSRLDTLQAAILLEKIKFFDEEIEKRQLVAQMYKEFLSEIQEIKLPYIETNNKSVYAQYTLLLQDSSKRSEIMELMKLKGIPTALYYPVPLHKTKSYFQDVELPNTDYCASHVLSLPMHPYLVEAEIKLIANTLKEVLKEV